MNKFNKFYFEKFEFDKETLSAGFYYSFDKKENFIETINFGAENFLIKKDLDDKIINNILFHIHIALGISYYKIFPTENLIVESGFLDDYQIKFWKIFYLNGLGEFFITNSLDPINLLNFSNNSSHIAYTTKIKDSLIDFKVGNKILLPLGGGKDSIVSYSLIKNIGLDFDTYVFGKLDDIKYNTSKIMGKVPLLITRTLSENLFILNKKGYYNGHVPITGLIAFISEAVCYFYDYKYIILSNEKSASEGNIVWKNIEINHQYSKSLEFEKDFSNYVLKYISKEIKYFSLLRGLYEYKIAKIFSEQKEFFNDFSSCNNNFKILGEKQDSLWCNSCDKCCFVYLILSPFIDQKELEKIFGENLFKKIELENIFKELIGLSKHKPFECVGTYEESIFSIWKYIENLKNIGEDLPIVLKKIEEEVYSNIKILDMKKLEEKLLKVSGVDIIPIEIKQKIKF